MDKMRQIDKMELSELRSAMWQVFQRVARTPDHDREISYFIGFMDRHQEILAGDGIELTEKTVDQDNPVENEKALKTMNKQTINYHISRDGWISLCGKTRYDSEENGDQIHWHYYPRELDEGTWCPECQAVWAKDPEIQACQS